VSVAVEKKSISERQILKSVVDLVRFASTTANSCRASIQAFVFSGLVLELDFDLSSSARFCRIATIVFPFA
jgi:hypothetical protein